MRALLRIAEQEEQYDTAVLTLRGPKEEKKLGAAIEDAVRELGAKDAAREVRQNPHLVGGFMLSYRGIEIDSSYKSKLLELYRRVTAG
jgi:F0F1-type ATP synthase delta subunit